MRRQSLWATSASSPSRSGKQHLLFSPCNAVEYNQGNSISHMTPNAQRETTLFHDSPFKHTQHAHACEACTYVLTSYVSMLKHPRTHTSDE